MSERVTKKKRDCKIWLPYEKLKLLRQAMRYESFYYHPYGKKLYEELKAKHGYSVTADALKSVFQKIVEDFKVGSDTEQDGSDEEATSSDVLDLNHFERKVLKAVKRSDRRELARFAMAGRPKEMNEISCLALNEPASLKLAKGKNVLNFEEEQEEEQIEGENQDDGRRRKRSGGVDSNAQGCSFAQSGPFDRGNKTAPSVENNSNADGDATKKKNEETVE